MVRFAAAGGNLITGASSSSSPSCLTGKERKGSCELAAGGKFVLVQSFQL